MKFLFDYLPIILFFAAYKLWNIYVATVASMIASCIQLTVHKIRYKRFEMMHIISTASIIILGFATIVSHNVMFIKWKPSIVYWAFAIAMLVFNKVTKKPFMKKLLQEKICLSDLVWYKITNSWILFFTAMGIANLLIVYFFSTNVWVTFKLFGSIALMLAFIIGQSIYIASVSDKNKTKIQC